MSKEYYMELIEAVEKKTRAKFRKQKMRDYDLSITLPRGLRNRVAKIIPYEYDAFDRNVFIGESADKLPTKVYADEGHEKKRKHKKKDPKQKKKKGVFNESTCSEIERMEKEFVPINLHPIKEVKVKEKPKKRVNMFSKYICEPRDKRIQWNSRMHHKVLAHEQKPLEQQAEEIIDESAQHFVEWFDSVGSRDSDAKLTKDEVKSLFSIETDRILSSAIHIEPREVNAIAKQVADQWDAPDMAIEAKYEDLLGQMLRQVPTKTNTVAFGRTIPVSERPWIPNGREDYIETYFPDELLSAEKLFKGISHLRTVKMLVEFYRERPHIPRPEYLVRLGMFDKKRGDDDDNYIPLFDLLKLKY